MDTTHSTYHPGAPDRLEALHEAAQRANRPDLFNHRVLGALATSASPEAWKTALEIAAQCDADDATKPAPAYTPPF